jgi:hypothetical protein
VRRVQTIQAALPVFQGLRNSRDAGREDRIAIAMSSVDTPIVEKRQMQATLLVNGSSLRTL